MSERGRQDWHSLLTVDEYEPGKWVMLDTLERPYAMIDFVRRGDELGYRVTTWVQEASQREFHRVPHGCGCRT